jgi:hypothetical protein
MKALPMIRALAFAGVFVFVGCSTPAPTDLSCPTSYCNSHGTCTEVNALPQCTCEEGYEGLNCLTCSVGFHRVGTGSCAPDEACATDTCGPNGTCVIVRGETECVCATGYDGPRCTSCYGPFLDVADAGELDAGTDGGLQVLPPAVCVFPIQCNDGSCPRGFSCDDSQGRIMCECLESGCMGQSCTATTCNGHGACDDSTGASRCACDVGYQGSRCETCYFGYRPEGDACVLADRCTPNACNGGGACGLDAGIAECRCTAGYEGAACERCATGFHRLGSGVCEADQACTSTTCGANSVCAVVGGVAQCTCAPGYAGGGCTQCYPGYHAVSAADGGFLCELDDRCRATSCGRGTCEDATGTVVCSNCPVGFTGAHCEVNVDDCGTACQTGQCLDLVGSRVCLCTDGTWGQTCLPGPRITLVTPASGPRAGGTTVTVTGTGFTGGTTVTVGGVPATGVNVLSATSLTFVTPASATLGVQSLVVRAPNGQLAQAQFTYAPLTFAFTGALQRFTVPAGVSSVSVQVWGAAGGGGDKSGIRGGAGGYASGTLSVDAGQVFTVVVGQGGARWFGLSLDGGVVDAGSGAGAGGGLSGLFTTMADGGISAPTALVIAGGGGGGGFFVNVPFGSSGGNGGGAFGGAGAVTGTNSLDARGQGGGPTVGGVGGCSTMGMGQCGQTGLPLQGGGGGVSSLTTPRIGATFGGGGAVGRSAEFNAGGGGGGYFGGGGGANETAQGGGGGSGFLAASVLNPVSSRSAVPGVPEQQQAIGYVPGVAVGGNVDGGTTGGPGLVLIGW